MYCFNVVFSLYIVRKYLGLILMYSAPGRVSWRKKSVMPIVAKQILLFLSDMVLLISREEYVMYLIPFVEFRLFFSISYKILNVLKMIFMYIMSLAVENNAYCNNIHYFCDNDILRMTQ